MKISFLRTLLLASILAYAFGLPAIAQEEKLPNFSPEQDKLPTCPAANGEEHPCVALYRARCRQIEWGLKKQSVTVNYDAKQRHRGDFLASRRALSAAEREEFLRHHGESFFQLRVMLAQLDEAIAKIKLADYWVSQGKDGICPNF